MNQNTLADRIQQLRRERGLSQEQLAEKLDVSRQAVSKWESAQAQPELDKIIALSELFGVTTDYLLKGSRDDLSEAKPAPGRQQDAAFSCRVLYLAALFFLTIGPVCALAGWYEERTAGWIAGGMVIQAIGLVCYGIGRLLHSVHPALWMVKTGCVVGLFLPLSVLAGWLADILPVPHFAMVAEGVFLTLEYAIALVLLTRLRIWDKL